MGNDKGNIASLQVLDNEIIRTKNNTKRSVLVFTQLGVIFRPGFIEIYISINTIFSNLIFPSNIEYRTR